MGVLLAIGAAVCWGVSDFIGGLRARRDSVLAVALVAEITSVLYLAAVFAVAGPGLPSAHAAGLGAAVGILSGVTQLGLYKALAGGNMARVAPVLAMAPAIPLLAGISYGETPLWFQWVGIALALGGTAAIAWERRSGEGRRSATQAAMLLAVAVTVAMGISQVALDHIADREDPVSAVFLIRIGAAGTLALAALTVARVDVRMSSGGIGVPVLIGIIATTAILLFAAAVKTAPLGITAVLAGQFPAVTVLLSVSVLGVRLAPEHVAGVALVLIGSGLMVAGAV